MADEVINTRIVADADFSSLIADVHRVTASLSKLQEQLANSNKMLANNVAVINRNFADTIRSTGQFSSHFVSLSSDVEKFGKNLDGGRLKLKDYFNTYQQHAKTTGGLIRDLAKQQVAMQNAILQPLGRNAQGLMQFNVHIPRGLDAIKSKTALARQELQIMNKVIQDGAGQLINWGKNTQWAGRQLTVGLTLPLAAFGKAASDAFRQADQELTRLTKVYGGVAATSTAELKKIRTEVAATAAQLSKDYGASFQETIGLAADIAATGKQGNELLSSIKETTRLAVLGEVDRQDAMKATLAIQSAFKSNTEELANSINFLNAVENQTSTTLNDLVEAIPKAGPVIKGLGGSVQDLALYLTAMREGGISASEGANALKSGLASLINPTDKAVGQFKSFGIDLLGIVNNNAGNVTQTLLDLQSALDKLNPLQKQQAIENLFGKFQFARMNALFENLGKQGSQTLQVLDLMKASTSDLANIAGRELAQVTESASGRYKRAIESLKADLAGVGEQFLTIGTKIINIVDKALQFFNNLPKPIKSAIAFVGALTALAGPLIMLTGLLANFFGYILKGVMHMKAFFKGGEGWKYLTPEMIAADKAGKMIEQTFYSDAKAASILQLALKNLIDEFSVLEAKARSGSVSVQPAVSTMAGNLIMGAGTGRVVNPEHPLAGEYGSRASTHMVPRGSMTEEQRMQQTIFGLVPGAGPVNRKIGNNPQIYMQDKLPNVPGITTVSGVSTGVVSGEAARWHTMMATLGMQSKEEINQLKKTIATTGLVTKDFMQQFDQVLPVVTAVTDNAAKESALIVAELRAGKLSVAQAREQIIALNLQVERDIAAAVGVQATSMGRTINPTMVPTLNQPVVDASGKSNMRELFKKGKTRDLINKIAGSLGVRTSGAGYNIETTRPKKFADGGTVVGGPRSETTDTQYMELNAGDFVLNRRASDNLLGFNNGGIVPAMVTPGEIVIHNPSADEIPVLEAYNNKFALGGRVTARKNNYGQMTTAQAMQMVRKATKFHEDPNYNDNIRIGAITSDAAILHGMGMDPNAAVQMATADYDDAVRYATGRDGTFSLNRFTRRRTELLKQIESNAPRLGLSVSPIFGGNGRQPVFNKFDKGIANIHKIVMESSKFSKGSKDYLSGLGLQAPKGQRSWVRGHYQRMGGLDMQGLEYLYQAAAIPSEINSFWATTENKRLGQDLLIPVAEGRGGAKALLQRTIEAAARRGGYRRQQVPTARDILTSTKNASPLQRMLREALAAAYSRKPALARFALGGLVGGSKNNYGRMDLGMPFSIKNKEMAAKIGSRVSSSRFRNVIPTDYGHLVKETTGHSFPVRGVGGIYRNPNGDGFVFVKPMMDETAALAELRATELARSAHGLNSPRQTIRVMKDPTDPTGKRTFIALESPYDPALAAGGSQFTKRDFFKQLVASLVRGDKDLSGSNVFGPNLADVGTAGVFSRASGSRSFSFNMPSMENQAMVNLLGVKGGAKRAFAESTVGIAKSMSPDAYHDAIIKEINTVLPRMRETVNSFKLNSLERKAYERMISRLEAGLSVDWRKFQGIHSNVKPKKFALGGMVGPNKSNYGRYAGFRSKVRGTRSIGRPKVDAEGNQIPVDPNSMMGTSMAGMALMMGGSMAPGPAGQIMGIAGMAMQMAPVLKMIGPLIKGMGTFAGLLAKLRTVGMAVFTALRVGLAALLGPVGLVSAAIGIAVFAFMKWKKAQEENKREAIALNGVTKKGAKELGIQYTTLTDKLKTLREEQKLAGDKAKQYFESYTGSGVNGLTLTIKQLKELKDSVKNNMKDTLDTLNKLDDSQVNQWATNLKAQLVASGKSASEATNTVYALIESSNKAGMGVGAISDKMFRGIVDKGTAANFIVENFAKNIDNIANVKPDALVSNVDTMITSLDSAVQSLVNTKDSTGQTITESAALATQFEKMAKSGVKNKEIGKETLDVLKAQRPEFAAILNKTDTIGGMYAKWRLLLQGVSIDLSKISSTQAETLATFTAALDSAAANAVAANGTVAGLEEARGVLKDLQDQYSKAKKASNADAVNSAGLSRKQIKAINDEIKAIQDRAAAKKKALQDSLNSENTQLELQKLQIEYQQALARGDKDAAMQAQISIRQLSKQYETQKAMDQLDANAKKEVDAKQAVLDKDAEYKQTLQDLANNAGNRMGKLGGTIQTIKDLEASLANAAKLRILSNAPGATAQQKEDFKVAFSNALQDIGKAAKSDPKVLEAFKQFFVLDAKGKAIKDAQGNYQMKSINEAGTTYSPTGGAYNMPKGGALTELDQLAKGMTDFAVAIIGKQGKTLSDIYTILAKGKPEATSVSFKDDLAGMKKVIASNAGDQSAQYKKPYDDEGFLTMAARKSIVIAKKLVKGDTFTDSNGNVYNVKNGYDSNIEPGYSVKRAMGGRVVPGIPYALNDGGKIEGIKFDRAGQVYPNANTMPRFNVPAGVTSGVPGGANNSYNNNVYNIDIALNGTNVTADDVMRKFKAELAMVNAREGRVRTYGGQV